MSSFFSSQTETDINNVDNILSITDADISNNSSTNAVDCSTSSLLIIVPYDEDSSTIRKGVLDASISDSAEKNFVNEQISCNGRKIYNLLLYYFILTSSIFFFICTIM